MHKLKRMLKEELYKWEEKGSLSTSDLNVIHILTDTIKNIDKIEKLEDGYDRGRGHYGRWTCSGDYDDDRSYHHREEHMVERIEEMMEETKNAREKDILKRCLAEMRNG